MIINKTFNVNENEIKLRKYHNHEAQMQKENEMWNQ